MSSWDEVIVHIGRQHSDKLDELAGLSATRTNLAPEPAGNDDLSRLAADLAQIPKRLRLHGSMRPMLPTTRAEPRSKRDVLRCLLGRHKVILSGSDCGIFIERCSCGAVRLDHRRWFGAHPIARRYTRLDRT